MDALTVLSRGEGKAEVAQRTQRGSVAGNGVGLHADGSKSGSLAQHRSHCCSPNTAAAGTMGQPRARLEHAGLITAL